MLGGKWTVLASTARRRHLKKGGELAERAELKAEKTDVIRKAYNHAVAILRGDV